MTEFRNVNVTCTDDGGYDYFSEGETYYVDGDSEIHIPDEGFREVQESLGGCYINVYGHTVEFELTDKSRNLIQVVASNRNFPTKKVNMIKRIREATGMGLKESKEISDKFSFDNERSNQEAVVEIPDKVCDQAAWGDIFRPLTNDHSTTYQEIQDLAARCVGNREFSFAKRLIEILEDLG